MRSALSGNNTGIRWTLFTSLEDLDYADDLALLSHLETHMQSKTSKLQSNASKIGLNINLKKTEVMSLNMKNQPKIQLNEKNIENTSSFTYLGSIVTSDGGTDKDIKARLGKARGSFIKLKNIWKSKSISRNTKIKLYNSCVLSVLLYGAECWMTEKDMNTTKITNENLHERTKSTDMRTILKKYRW